MSIKCRTKRAGRKPKSVEEMTLLEIFLGMAANQIATDMSVLLPVPLTVVRCGLLERGHLKLRKRFDHKAIRFDCRTDDPATPCNFTFFLDPEAAWYLPSALLLRPFPVAEKHMRWSKLDRLHEDALAEICNQLAASFKKSVLKIRGCGNFREGELVCAQFLLSKLRKEDPHIEAVFSIKDVEVTILIKVSPTFIDLIDGR